MIRATRSGRSAPESRLSALGLVELVGGRLESERHDLLGDLAVLGDRHDEDRAASQVDEMDGVDPFDVGLGSDDDGGEMRDVCEEAGGLFQETRDLPMDFAEELPDPLLCCRSQPPRRAVIDVVAVSLVGRDATGRRVRLDGESVRLETREFAPHRRRGHVEAASFDDRLGAHRFAGDDVLLDEGLQHTCFSIVQHLQKLAVLLGD